MAEHKHTPPEVLSWIHGLPKIELHLHLEGAIPHGALFDLIEKYGGDPSVPDVAALQRKFEYDSFQAFLQTWGWKNQFLREYEDFTHVARALAENLDEQNVRYAEVFFSPSLFSKKGLEVGRLTQAVRAGLDRVDGIRIALVADLVRDYGADRELETLAALAEARDQGVVGIGIGGSEHEFPPELFEGLFQRARAMGFHTTAHAGEAAGADSVRTAVELLGAERIGHGIRASEDQELLELLTERQIPLEICPTSNLCTGVVASIDDHPIRRFFDAGLLVTLNTDDPQMFGCSLESELALLHDRLGFTPNELRSLMLNGIRAAWLPQRDKLELTRAFLSDPSWSD